MRLKRYTVKHVAWELRCAQSTVALLAERVGLKKGKRYWDFSAEDIRLIRRQKNILHDHAQFAADEAGVTKRDILHIKRLFKITAKDDINNLIRVAVLFKTWKTYSIGILKNTQ